jgi:hypothetical protein
MLDGPEQRDAPGLGQVGALLVLGEVALQRVVAGHLMELAAHPPVCDVAMDQMCQFRRGAGYAGKK